jgi:hypothetical protein
MPDLLKGLLRRSRSTLIWEKRARKSHYLNTILLRSHSVLQGKCQERNLLEKNRCFSIYSPRCQDWATGAWDDYVFRRPLFANIYTESALIERSLILWNTRNIAFTQNSRIKNRYLKHSSLVCHSGSSVDNKPHKYTRSYCNSLAPQILIIQFAKMNWTLMSRFGVTTGRDLDWMFGFTALIPPTHYYK